MGNRIHYLQFVQSEPSIFQEFKFYQGVSLNFIASNIGLKLTICLNFVKKLKLQLQQQALFYSSAFCYESFRVYINCLKRLGLTFGKTSSVSNINSYLERDSYISNEYIFKVSMNQMVEITKTYKHKTKKLKNSKYFL